MSGTEAAAIADAAVEIAQADAAATHAQVSAEIAAGAASDAVNAAAEAQRLAQEQAQIAAVQVQMAAAEQIAAWQGDLAWLRQTVESMIASVTNVENLNVRQGELLTQTMERLTALELLTLAEVETETEEELTETEEAQPPAEPAVEPNEAAELEQNEENPAENPDGEVLRRRHRPRF